VQPAASTSSATLSGKTCLVTGATAGIGRVTARELARPGARVFLVARDPTRGEALAREIRGEGGSAEMLVADLSSQAEVRGLAQRFLSRGGPLHVLVNNAGVFELSRKLRSDGIETVFAVNHLAYFLLTLLLLERLRASAPARVVNVASEAHRWGTMDFDDLEGAKSYRPMRIYGRSKLANVLFTYELARRLAGSGVTVNCLHPGTVATGLGSQNGTLARLLISLLRPFLRTPEGGASTTIYLAASPEVTDVSGGYFIDCRRARSSEESCDPQIARRLWERSAEMTALDHPSPSSDPGPRGP
jgi:NAD(P)-dependent dehydrogenase (short-subunit alcohol dehydrogenase family)